MKRKVNLGHYQQKLQVTKEMYTTKEGMFYTKIFNMEQDKWDEKNTKQWHV